MTSRSNSNATETSGRDALDDRTHAGARGQKQPPAPAIPSATVHPPIDRAHQIIGYWFGEHFDLDVVDAALATAAAERLDGDPLWLMLVGASGSGKTEILSAVVAATERRAMVSSVTEAGLLSGTPRKDLNADSTGGLLKHLGDRGVLGIKDFTSIIAQSRDARARTLAALREIYDGSWSRTIGSDGGRSLDWRGRIGVLAACTTLWDSAHEVVAAAGDRFVVVRPTAADRLASGRHSLTSVGRESQMREDLIRAARDVLTQIMTDNIDPSPETSERLIFAAELVTRARTAAERDFKGEPTGVHAPEAPTRFLKQLGQLYRGARAIGLSEASALALALRAARDSVPPLRLAILEAIAAGKNIVKATNRPRSTIDREIEILKMLDLVTVGTGRDEDNRPLLRIPRIVITSSRPS